MLKLGKEYFDCPQRCVTNKADEYNAYRTQLCKTCPRRIRAQELERKVLNEWDKWFKPSELYAVTSVTFDRWLTQLYRTRSLDEEDLNIGSRAYKLMRIYREEQDRYDEIVRDNK